MGKNNIFQNIPSDLNNEIFENIIKNKNFRLERIISSGQSTPPDERYDQETDEWVILLSGSAEILFEENQAQVGMKPGDYLFIPRHCRHRVERTSFNEISVWLAIHID